MELLKNPAESRRFESAVINKSKVLNVGRIGPAVNDL